MHYYLIFWLCSSMDVVAVVIMADAAVAVDAFVDYDHERLWIFGTPNDRCHCGNSCGSPKHINHTCGTEPSGICHGNDWIQTWSSRDLKDWETALAGGTKGIAVPNM